MDRREERLRQVYESVEVNLQLIGAIGIEDRLQVSYLLYEQIKSKNYKIKINTTGKKLWLDIWFLIKQVKINNSRWPSESKTGQKF